MPRRTALFLLLTALFWRIAGGDEVVRQDLRDVNGVAPAVRTAKVDSNGVMRWEDDGTEVSLWGVNYYTPFSGDYAAMKARGLDHKAEIMRDLEHFLRLGLSSLRIHCFDRQFSGLNGEFIDNEHVELLDFLIARAARYGMYTVLTPIAWWGRRTPSPQGFSGRFSMQEMTTKREAWTCQAKFLKAFGEHVNRFTGRRYADEPSVVAFELINEPLYPKDTSDELVVEYANFLADALRSSGTRKPVFYNSWGKRNAALSRARVDGVSGSYYPTWLDTGRIHFEPRLGSVKESLLAPVSSITNRARMIYEFDAPDTPGTYMYPALARLFRSEGVQIANMFQYDPLALAPCNANWKTHFLNLVYSPGKALSLAIAGECFRRWPRGSPFRPDARELRYPPCRVNAEEDVSEFVTDTALIHTNDTEADPPAPERLTRVWGIGASKMAASSGNGAYFLDRLDRGLWNLQIYPSVAMVQDVYSGGTDLKVVVTPGSVRFSVFLPDLGETWSVWSAGRSVGRAQRGIMTLEPGEYLLTRASRLPDGWRATRTGSGIAAYVTSGR